MKKIEFLRLVCIELARMGVEEDEIKIQCCNIDRYLTSMGVGAESPALDHENPAAFAKLIYGNIAKKQPAPAPANEKPAEPVVAEEIEEAVYVSEPVFEAAAEDGAVQENDSEVEFSDEMPDFDEVAAPVDSEVSVAEEEEEIKIFDGGYHEPVLVNEEIVKSVESEFEALPEYESPEEAPAPELYNPFEEEDQIPQTVNGTIEFNVSSLKKKQPPVKPAVEEEEDYFEKSEEEEYIPSGNPALFWVLVALTSFLWIPLGVLFFVGVGISIVLMIAFEILYIPALVAIIIGGSAVSFAEVIYSIIKFAGKNPAVALFELGLGFLVAALTVGLPTGMYYLGVSVFPKWIKNYGRNVKKLMKKIRRLYRKLKGACSI